jgi:hypothetical protein
MYPTAGLDDVEYRKISYPTVNQTLVVQPLTRLYTDRPTPAALNKLREILFMLTVA